MVMIGVASSSLIWRVFVVTIRSYRETQIKDMVNFDIWMHMEKNKQSSTDKARPIFLIIKLLGLAQIGFKVFLLPFALPQGLLKEVSIYFQIFTIKVVGLYAYSTTKMSKM